MDAVAQQRGLEAEPRRGVVVAARDDDRRTGVGEGPQGIGEHAVAGRGGRCRVEHVARDDHDVDIALAHLGDERLEHALERVERRVAVERPPDVPVRGVQDAHDLTVRSSTDIATEVGGGSANACHDGGMTDPAAPLDVVAAVIEDAGLVLACRRRPGKAAAGRWEFPGGKIEPGETPAQALVREIREELGIGIHVTGHLTTDVTGGIRLVCLRARLEDERPVRSTDHDAMDWLPRDGLETVDWADADLPAVRLLAAGHRGAAPVEHSPAVRRRAGEPADRPGPPA